jgi:hypothetical protein
VSYQNGVNRFNLDFTKACGSILTNYCWKDIDLSESVKWSLYSGFLPKGNIYFGVDVWAQNKSSFTHPRVTYPEYGGGGTNTGVAMAKLAEYGLSVGIFAPAWSFEHFPGHERHVECTVWEGTPLPENVDCSCGDCASRHPPNKELAILRTAKERVAGSEHFFYTDFSRAFSTHNEEAKEWFDGADMHAQLGAQSVLPRPAILATSERAVTLSPHIESERNRHLLVISATQNRSTDSETIEEFLPLYKLDMPADGSLQLLIVPSTISRNAPFHKTPHRKDAVISIYLKTTKTTRYLPLPLSGDPTKLIDQVPTARIRELGVHMTSPCGFPLGEPVRILGISEICIKPSSASLSRHEFEITHVRLEERGEGEARHVRLTWRYGGTTASEWQEMGMPWSHVTGPFAYFTIHTPRLCLARVYGLEHILDEKFVNAHAGEEIDVEVLGIGFEGRRLAEKKVKLQL